MNKDSHCVMSHSLQSIDIAKISIGETFTSSFQDTY